MSTVFLKPRSDEVAVTDCAEQKLNSSKKKYILLPSSETAGFHLIILSKQKKGAQRR